MPSPAIHRGPIPNPMELKPTQVAITASVYPDQSSKGSGGFHVMMGFSHQSADDEVTFGLAPVETYPTQELAEARVMEVAAEWQATDVFIETP